MSDVEARRELISLAQAMLDGELSYLEGTAKILRVLKMLSDIEEPDRDMDVFILISSETDHLPFENDRHLWSKEALNKLEPVLKRTEDWAKSVARDACKNLVQRYGRS